MGEISFIGMFRAKRSSQSFLLGQAVSRNETHRKKEKRDRRRGEKVEGTTSPKRFDMRGGTIKRK